MGLSMPACVYLGVCAQELGEDKSDGTDKLLQKFKHRLEGKTIPKAMSAEQNRGFEPAPRQMYTLA
eukprot:4690594-Amphidinium_carterae.3